MSTLATLVINVVANVNQAKAALSGVSSSMVSTGRSMSSVGRTLNRNVTLPLLAIGAASTKMALDYNSAFTRISAISNTSAEDVARWKEEVKGLAEATGRDPIELADALFFLASAGLETSQVMDTLKATAKASAVGLGEMTDIAKLTANVLNAYKSSGITAAQATDTLVAAVKAGTAEPEEFAGAMGRILPIASRARVGFDQVAASLAALSNIGLDVNEGVTAMRGLLQSLVAPTDMAREAMKKIGLTAQDLLDAFQQDGILGALTLLEERTAKAADTEAEMFDIMRRVVPNVRALTGQLGLTGENAETVAQIFDQVTDSTGALGDAMKKTEQDPAFQMAQRFAQLKVAAIELGNKLIPIAQDIVGVVSDLADAFTKLSPAMQDNIVKWGLIAMAVGPVLRVFGGLLTIGGKLVGVLSGVGGALGLAGVGGAGGAAAKGVGPMAMALSGLAPKLAPVAAGVGLVSLALLELATEAQPSAEQVGAISAELQRMGGVSQTHSAMMVDAWNKQTEAGQGFFGGLKDWASEWLWFSDSAVEAHEKASNAWEQGTAAASKAILDQITLAHQQGGSFDRSTGALIRNLVAQGKFAEAAEVLNRALLRQRTNFMRGIEAIIGNKQAFETWAPILHRSTELTNRQRQELGGLIGATARAGLTIRGSARDQLQAAIATGDFSAAVRILFGLLNRLPPNKKTNIDIPGIDSAIEGVRSYKNWLESIPERVRTTIVVSREQGFGGPTEQDHAGGLIMHAGGSVLDALRAREVPAILERGEFVVRKEAVRQLGLPFLEQLNRMHFGGGVGQIGRGSRLGRAPMARQPDFSQSGGSRGPVRLVGILETEWGPAEVQGWIVNEVSELGQHMSRAGRNRRPVG